MSNNFDNENDYVFIDIHGNEVDKKEWFDSVNYLEDGYAIVKLNGKYNLVNASGELLWDEWHEFASSYYFFNNGGILYVLVKKDGLYNYRNTQGKLVSRNWFEKIEGSFRNGDIKVKENNVWKTLDINGNIKIDIDGKETFNEERFNSANYFKDGYAFSEIDKFKNGYAKVYRNIKYRVTKEYRAPEYNYVRECNFINKNGELVSKYKWFATDGTKDFKDGYAIVRTIEGKYFLMATNGTLIGAGYEEVDYFVNGYARVKLESGGCDEWNFIDTNGNLINDKRYSAINSSIMIRGKGTERGRTIGVSNFRDGYAEVHTDSEGYKFVDTSGKEYTKDELMKICPSRVEYCYDKLSIGPDLQESDFKDGYALINIRNSVIGGTGIDYRMALVDNKGNIFGNKWFSSNVSGDIPFIFSQGYLIVDTGSFLNEKMVNIMDANGKFIDSRGFTSVKCYDNYFLVKKHTDDGQYMYNYYIFDANGKLKLLSKKWFDEASEFRFGYARVKKSKEFNKEIAKPIKKKYKVKRLIK